jgi:hypothetical protein
MTDPKFEIDEPVNVVSDGQLFPGTVLGTQFLVPLWFYVVELDEVIETDNGPQRGLFVPESSLEECSDEPKIIDTEWARVGSYVYVCNQDQVNEGHPEAIDVEVRLVHDSKGKLYVQTVDEIDGISLWDNIPYDDQEQAQAVAQQVIDESHEAEPGEAAASYLERVMAEERA